MVGCKGFLLEEERDFCDLALNDKSFSLFEYRDVSLRLCVDGSLILRLLTIE